MRSLALAALVTSLTLTGCAATTGSASSAPATSGSDEKSAVDHPEMMSRSHPYCMYVRQEGRLTECWQFNFGRCTFWGPPCKDPGWIVRPGDAGAAPPASATPPAQ